MTILFQKHQRETSPDSLIRQFGSFSNAWSLHQENLVRYSSYGGFLAYRKYQNNKFVLGDPICKDSNLKQLLEDFDRTSVNSCFVQISEKPAKILAEIGYDINYFGSESILHLPYSRQGKVKREVRNLFNAATQKNIQVRELTSEEIFKTQRIFTKDCEYSFLIRPLHLKDQSACRVFGAFQDNQIMSYSIYDPIYLNKKIVGYAESINRRTVNAVKGARVYTLLKAGDIFLNEGIKFINLGLLPFYPTEYQKSDKFVSNSITKILFKILYNSSPFFHNFKGLSFHKSRYNGILLPKYFASKKKIPIVQLLQIYKLTTGSYFPRLTD
ncbi:MAG: DUF2156 domain-containing protein [Calditrichaeota bacterium]|nr:MAG: DUF2156 domain-containing protein [Calditrichota bacterium]